MRNSCTPSWFRINSLILTVIFIFTISVLSTISRHQGALCFRPLGLSKDFASIESEAVRILAETKWRNSTKSWPQHWFFALLLPQAWTVWPCLTIKAKDHRCWYMPRELQRCHLVFSQHFQRAVVKEARPRPQRVTAPVKDQCFHKLCCRYVLKSERSKTVPKFWPVPNFRISDTVNWFRVRFPMFWIPPARWQFYVWDQSQHKKIVTAPFKNPKTPNGILNQ